MLKVGDTVKVIGKTLDGQCNEVEFIPIGTICDIIGITDDPIFGILVEIRPKNNKYFSIGYCYSLSAVEKGHLIWVKDE